MNAFVVSPQAMQEAYQLLGTGNNVPGASQTQAETPDDKMMMTQQKHELDMSRERMKQDHAVGMEQLKQQAALGQKYADNQAKLAEFAKKNDELRQKERDFRFETTIKDALAANGCTKIDLAYRMIAPDLTLDEAGQRIFITVDTPSGDVDWTHTNT